MSNYIIIKDSNDFENKKITKAGIYLVKLTKILNDLPYLQDKLNDGDVMFEFITQNGEIGMINFPTLNSKGNLNNATIFAINTMQDNSAPLNGKKYRDLQNGENFDMEWLIGSELVIEAKDYTRNDGSQTLVLNPLASTRLLEIWKAKLDSKKQAEEIAKLEMTIESYYKKPFENIEFDGPIGGTLQQPQQNQKVMQEGTGDLKEIFKDS